MKNYPYSDTTNRFFFHTVDWSRTDLDGIPIFGHAVQRQVLVDSRTLGASADNWKALKASGRQAGSFMEGVRHGGYCHADGFYQYYKDNSVYPGSYTPQKGYAQGAISGFPNFPAPLTSVSTIADSTARRNFLNKCLSARKSWRGGNFLAEFAETVHMLKNPLVGLAENIGGLARGASKLKGLLTKGDVAAYSYHLGNLWLEYSFGWKPLFEDIKDANQALLDLADGNRCDTKRVFAAGTEQTYTPKGYVTPFLGDVAPYTISEWYNKTTQNVKYYGALTARPANITTVLDTFGIDPGDFIPAVWEAIPWSFFVDYFLNVQEQLDSMQFAFGDFGWIMQGVRNVTADYYLPPVVPQGISEVTQNVIKTQGGGACSSTTYVRRSPQSSIPFPTFNFRVPGLGSLKWVNVAALAAQIAASSPNARA